MAEKTGELPEMKGKGVEKLTIAAIDKAAEKYEQKKDARCRVSPAEHAAKEELLTVLHKNRDKLPRPKDQYRQKPRQIASLRLAHSINR